MMSARSVLSRTIEFIRFPMILGILFIHNNLFHFNVISLEDTNSWIKTIIFFFSGTYGSLCVPLFFFISGYLFYKNITGCTFTINIYREKLKKRIHSLLIPYIFWNLITLLLYWTLGDGEISLSSFFSAFWKYNDGVGETRYTPVNGPLWFMRDLMLVSLISPIVYWIIRKLGVIPIFVLFMCWGSSNDYYTKFFGLTFFSIGAYFSIREIDLLSFCKKYYIVHAFLILVIIETAIGVLNLRIPFFRNIYIIVGIFGLLYLTSIIVEKLKIVNCSFLASASFLIYVAHVLLEGKMRQFLISMFGLDTALDICIVYFVPVILTSVLLICVYYMIKECIPWGMFSLGGR